MTRHVPHRLPHDDPPDRCNFCGASEVQTLYLCGNFKFRGQYIFKGANGYWGACAECAALIDVDNWKQLTVRVLAMGSRRTGFTADHAA